MRRCNNCEERWRQVISNQENSNNMKDQAAPTEKVVDTNVGTVNIPQGENKNVKPDVNKIIEDRRKAINEGKVVNK